MFYNSHAQSHLGEGNQDAGILGTKPLKANVTKKSSMQELPLASFMPGNIEFPTPNWQEKSVAVLFEKYF